MATKPQIALVTGANRGIGFEVCRQLAQKGLRVLLGARDLSRAKESASALAREGLEVTPVKLDVTSDSDISAVVQLIEKQYGKLDVLVNNAGGGYDPNDLATTSDLAKTKEMFDTNLFGVWRMCIALTPLLLKAAPGSRIVNVSSEAGSLTSAGHFAVPRSPIAAGYSVSKAALNALTIKLAAALKDKGVLVNSVCPGWTATYPGALEQGARPVKDGAAGITWAATLPPGGPTGEFFRDGKKLDW